MGANRQRIETTLPRDGELNPAKEVSPTSLSLVARFASIQQKLESGSHDTDKSEQDKLAAPWVDAAFSRHPNLKQLEDDLRCTKAYVSQMRNGHTPAPLRMVVPLLQHPDCIDALTNAIRADAGLPLAPRRAARVSREQLLEMALAIFVESPGLLRTLINEAGTRYGANAEDVAVALTASK